jgi:hypothetical protein
MVTSELRDRITQNLDRLNPEQLKSVVDFVEFLQYRQNTTATDYSDTWTDEDIADVSAFSLQYAATIYPDGQE